VAFKGEGARGKFKNTILGFRRGGNGGEIRRGKNVAKGGGIKKGPKKSAQMDTDGFKYYPPEGARGEGS